MTSPSVDALLAEFGDVQRAALQRTRESIGELLPGADEAVAWGMPTWRIDGDAVLSIMGFARHNSVFPQSGAVVERLAGRLTGYVVTKGTIHFDLATPFPRPLMKALLTERIREINDTYPRAAGEFKAFYDNGVVKAKGRMRQGEVVGDWTWRRRDGSIMRTGAFKAGRQVGEWTTFDRAGHAVKVTDFGR